ncbi:MAG: hypothetical protein HY898_34695 [Deltaproteobacteria bacterium]|nr:hypothetical protein [Deltaproteobacteria bacterium]
MPWCSLFLLAWVLVATPACTPSSHRIAPLAPAASPGGSSTTSGAPRGTDPLLFLLPGASMGMHLDASRLRSAPVFASMIAWMKLTGAKEHLPPFEEQCGLSPWEAVNDLVVSEDKHRLVAATLAIPADRVLRCLERIAKGKPSTFEGLQAVAFDDGKVCVDRGGLLLYGAQEAVRGVLRRGPEKGKLAEHLGLAPDAFLIAWGEPTDGPFRSASAVGRAAPTLFSLDFRADLGTAETARQAAVKVDEGLARAREGVPAGVVKTLESLKLSVEGSTVVAKLELRGSAEDQAAGIGTAAALGVVAVRRYLAQSKTSEARYEVQAIARGLQSYLDGQLANGRALRFPPSAPRVPASIPKGIRVQTAPSDWEHPTWKAALFSISEPQYYSYEIITAPDRKSARVKAYGDLDGDGRSSTFEVQMEVTRTGEVLIHSLQETDPLE